MIKLKFVAVAALMAAMSLGASASGDIDNLNPLAVPSSFTVGGSLGGTGSLNDVWNFVTSEKAYAAGSASTTSTYVNITGVGLLFDISSFAASIDSTPLNILTTSSLFFGGGSYQTTKTLSIAPIVLAPGPHTFNISGLVGPTGGGYTATLSLSPTHVPEPETLAMMLAGLGALGFLARRRQND